MATLTISLAGSAIVTGSKTYNVSDADLQRILNWATATYFPNQPAPPPQQVLLRWIQQFISATIVQEQNFSTPLPTTPTPVNIQ